MAKEKVDLTRLTLNQLSELTGSSYRTIKKRISSLEPIEKDGNSLFYNPVEALPLIILNPVQEKTFYDQNDNQNSEILIPELEAAKLAKARTEKLLIETEMLKRKLIPASEVENVWSDLAIAFRTKILAVPNRIGPQLVGQPLKKIERILNSILREALNELSEYEPNAENDSESCEESFEAGRPAAGIDDDAMGG